MVTVELTVTSVSSLLCHGLRKTFTPLHPFFLSPALPSRPGGGSDPSFLLRTGWRRGPVAVENGCHDNSAQLYPITLGESVSCPPPAGPHHADEGQHLCPWQLGVPAGKDTCHSRSYDTVTTCCTASVQSEVPHSLIIIALCAGMYTIIIELDDAQFASYHTVTCSIKPWMYLQTVELQWWHTSSLKTLFHANLLT